tara:strand:- start:792 stop:1025 length:234 start_codon:yes stop_codon:yes gene_type:complete
MSEQEKLKEEYIQELKTTDPRHWKIHEIYPNVGNMQKLIKSLHEELQAQKEKTKRMGELLGECFELYTQCQKESNND